MLIPALDVSLGGIHIDGEVEEVGHHHAGLGCASTALRPPGLQHVQPFEDEDIGLLDPLHLAGHDVIGLVGVHRCFHHRLACLQRPQEGDHSLAVVAFRKALALHQAARLQHPVGMQEAVGGDQRHPGVIGPASQQRLQHPREGALAHRHAARNADHVGARPHRSAQEVVAHARERLGRTEVQVQKPGQRQVDFHHLGQRDLVVDATQGDQLGLGQCQRRAGAQAGPFRAAEALVGGKAIPGLPRHHGLRLRRELLDAVHGHAMLSSITLPGTTRATSLGPNGCPVDCLHKTTPARNSPLVTDAPTYPKHQGRAPTIRTGLAMTGRLPYLRQEADDTGPRAMKQAIECSFGYLRGRFWPRCPPS